MERDPMENVVMVSIKKNMKNYITTLQNVPKGKIDSILKGCKKCFGCGGSTGGEGSKDSIILQGDQTDNLKKHKEALLDGLEIRFADK